RCPAGTGCVASSAATSNIPSSVVVRMTPAWSKRASTPTSKRASAAEWLRDGRVDAAERPDLTATMGFVRATFGARRATGRGLPKLARESSTTRVRGSSAQYARRSLLETSARLPADTKVDTPRFMLQK